MTGPTYAGIADLMAEYPAPVRRELRCHPHVARWLGFTLREARPEVPFTGAIGSLSGIPVFEAEDFEPGAWELREDGDIKVSGHIEVPAWFIKLLEPVPFDISIPPVFERRRMDYWFPIAPPVPMAFSGIC